MYRTNTCGELRLADAGKSVTLAGWVQRVRRMGGMTFVDLRDRYGITQIVFDNDTDASLCDVASHLGREYVVEVKGRVAERTSKNPHLPTGDIEIIASELRVLNPSEVPPFTIEDDTDGGDDLRMKFRYLDLRRTPVRRNLEPLGRVDLLVNNAGLAAGLEHIDKGDTADWDAMIDTNVKGLLYVTRVITPKMVAAGGGHVFNIGSIAGTEPYENGAVYCASKHAVHAISQAMRADLLASGIKVTEIRPGMVETEFSEVRFHGDKERADRVYDGVEPLTGDDIAEAIAWAAQLPAHMNVNEMVLMPSQQAGAYYTHRKN